MFPTSGFGKSRDRGKPLFWEVSARGASPVMREGKWKLHFRDRRGKSLELYDLTTDPTESRNVTAQHPDVASDLKAKL